MQKLLVLGFCLGMFVVFNAPPVASVAEAHPGVKNHPTRCKYYKGRPKLRRKCIRKCLHPHGRSGLKCIRKFKRRHP